MITSGARAELAVADSLQIQGYEIIERNWKTNRCEIDVIARTGDVIYFVEVKYRISANQGSGLAYILPRKLKQMELAARSWNQFHDWTGDWRLMAAEVTSSDFSHIELVEL